MPQPRRACLRDMKIEPVPSSTVPVEGIRLQGRLAQIDVTGNLVVKLEDHEGATATGHTRLPSSDEPEEPPLPLFGRACRLTLLGAATLAALSIGALGMPHLAHGDWCIAPCGAWCIVHGAWCIAHGPSHRQVPCQPVTHDTHVHLHARA